MSAHIVGYARVSTNDQDLTAQRNQLAVLGVPADRIYTDHGLTGTNRDRPGLRQALAAVRDGDTLVITKLDRLARSLPEVRCTGSCNVDLDVRVPSPRLRWEHVLAVTVPPLV